MILRGKLPNCGLPRLFTNDKTTCLTTRFKNWKLLALTKEKLHQIAQKLKTHWGITSNKQLLVILFVFAITGPTTLLVERFMFNLFEIPAIDHWLFRVAFFMLFTLPVYKALLLFYGLIFGQFAFFSKFVKAFFVKILMIGKSKKR